MQPTVTNARSLQGLMTWLTRAEWGDWFAEVYDHHLLPACRRTGFDAEEVMAILGESWFMTTVWGCAFEDFLTREGADGRNIVDDYLKRRGWKESASARAYMSALRTSVMSVYEVSDIVRDTSFRARDLVRGGEPILISERSATRSLKQWDRIATRVVRIGSQMLISGAVLPYDREASEKVLKLLRNVASALTRKSKSLPTRLVVMSITRRSSMPSPRLRSCALQPRQSQPSGLSISLIVRPFHRFLRCVTPKGMSWYSTRCIIPSRMASRPTTSGWH
jgi:hypothetical protein